MSIQVEQGPDGTVTTTTTTDNGQGGHTTSTSYSSDASSGASKEDSSDSNEASHTDVQSAYDEHVAERIQDVRVQLVRGELSTAQAEDLMAFFTSQTYLNSWVQQHMQEEQQRQKDLAQVSTCYHVQLPVRADCSTKKACIGQCQLWRQDTVTICTQQISSCLPGILGCCPLLSERSPVAPKAKRMTRQAFFHYSVLLYRLHSCTI